MFDIRNSPFGNMVWFVGTIENVQDPEDRDRVQVRCFGFHTDDRAAIPTTQLPWAPILNTGARLSGNMFVPGNLAVGFFLDGNEAQQPVVFGVLTGVPTTKNQNKGFSDPDGIYPKNLNVPDNSAIARGNSAPAAYASSTAAQNIPTAAGGSFSEPKSAYAVKYPADHVFETDAGQVIELDDTPGAERIHIFHRMGSFVEMHPDGTVVHRSLKNHYKVVFADDNAYVAGSLNVSAAGDINFATSGTMTFSAQTLKFVGSTVSITSSGSLTTYSGGSTSIQSSGALNMNSSGSLSLSTSGSASMTASGSALVQGGPSASIQGSSVQAGSFSMGGSGGSGSGASGSAGAPVSVPKLSANAAANTTNTQ